MTAGLDVLLVAHPLFPKRMVLRETPKNTPLGFFWNTAGPAKDFFIEAITAGFRTFRIHCWWSDAHVIVPMNVLEVVLEEIRKVIELVPGAVLTLYVSHSCEHAERDVNEVRKRVQMVKRVLPNAIPVNSISGGAVLPGTPTEQHLSVNGSWPTCDMASTDGANIYDLDAARYLRRYCSGPYPSFLWGFRFNLREIPDPGQKPPPIRNRKAAPSLEYFRSIVRLLSPPGGLPPGVERSIAMSQKPFAAPCIYKTHAEDDQEVSENDPDDVRENRPVLIIKPNVGAVDVLACNGTVVARFPRWKAGGDFGGGLTRYYAGLDADPKYGYQLGNQAKKASGSEYVWFRAGRSILGPVHPAFRAGVFRD